MKIPYKTLLIITFMQLSVSIITSASSNDTLQSGNSKQGSNEQKAMFHPTILYFQTGSDILDSQALLLIDKMVSDTKNNTNVSFTISGFTDPAGSETYNQTLSEKRAEKVKAELIKRGFSENQLITKALGESKSANISLTDYPKMRKVEIKSIIVVN